MERARLVQPPPPTERTPDRFDRWAEACATFEAEQRAHDDDARRFERTIEAELATLEAALEAQRERAEAAERDLLKERARADEATEELATERAGRASLEEDLYDERQRLRTELDRSDEQRRRLAKRLTEWRSQVGKSAQHEVEAALKRAEAREAARRVESEALQSKLIQIQREHERHSRTFAERMAQLESELAEAQRAGGADDLLGRCEASERRCVQLESEAVELRAAAAARAGEQTGDHELRELRTELDLHREHAERQARELAELRERLAAAEALANDDEEQERRAALALGLADRAADDERRDALVEELRRELSEAERELAQEREIRRALEEQAPLSPPPGLRASGILSGGSSELQRRYDLAMDDVRALKRRVADLEEETTAARAAGASAKVNVTGGAMDWESQKRRLLEQLDEDTNEVSREERSAIENAIRVTDEAIAEKEQELTELRRILEYREAVAPGGAMGAAAAVGAAALGAALDVDELIVEERARLKALQEEWQEKLRSAEVDLSLERARLSRERLELEEVKREIDEFRKEGGGKRPDSKTDAGPKRRWMFRLGLNEE